MKLTRKQLRKLILEAINLPGIEPDPNFPDNPEISGGPAELSQMEKDRQEMAKFEKSISRLIFSEDRDQQEQGYFLWASINDDNPESFPRLKEKLKNTYNNEKSKLDSAFKDAISYQEENYRHGGFDERDPYYYLVMGPVESARWKLATFDKVHIPLLRKNNIVIPGLTDQDKDR